ncbi:MAG: T9SS C-terminal target domain-containing protein [Bacteroidetes bacterium]|nr:MAG: T9SS C-terminal target domain-containing protein [Bacteroidota bacterium]
MLTRYFLSLSFIFIVFFSHAQTFYRVGSEENVETEPLFGILLAGGATDNNQGMAWLAERANGGDVVVLRASGSDGYNNYIYSQLGVEVNSVTSIVITSSEQANSEEVCDAVENAELIFIAGGNQWNYYSHWKGTCLQVAINNHVNEKAAPIGGTSAGLAVLGEVVFTAENNSVWSEEALNNPYHFRVKLSNEFLDIPFMENVVTDSHYNAIYGDNNNRHGRHMVFMARMITDWGMEAKGIGVNEYTAVAVDENGTARVFGNPNYPDYAYFLKSNAAPEVCEEDEPITWFNNQMAVSVYEVKGDFQGSNTFDMATWEDGTGGEWWAWYILEGELIQIPESQVYVSELGDFQGFSIFPNPADKYITLENFSNEPVISYSIINLAGATIKKGIPSSDRLTQIDLSGIRQGIYMLKVSFPNREEVRKIIKK